MFDQFTRLVADSSEWAYALILVIAVIDAALPIVPSEAAVITAGVVAAGGDLSLPAVIGAAAAGAFCGDNLGYGIGRRYGTTLTRRLVRGAKSRRKIEWAQRALARRGGELITIARFIPGGRTAITLTAGSTGFGWHRFVRYDAIAAAIWAIYAASLGYFGGHAFEQEAWKGLLAALALAVIIALTAEAIRWVVRHRRHDRFIVRASQAAISRGEADHPAPSLVRGEPRWTGNLTDSDLHAVSTARTQGPHPGAID